MKKILAVLLFFLAFGGNAMAQEKDSLSVKKHLTANPVPFHVLQLSADSVAPDHFGVEVGTSVFTNFKHGFGFNEYVAPRYSFSTGKRWHVDLFSTVGVTRLENMPIYSYYLNEYSRMNGRYYYASLMGQITYAVNEKLFLGGTGFANNTFIVDNEMNDVVRNLTNYGSSLFVGYKFSDKFSMQAEFSISKYGNPYQGEVYNIPGGYPQVDSYRTNPVQTVPLK